MSTALIQTAFNAPGTTDITSDRIYVRGKLAFLNGGSYITGGLLPNLSSTSVLAPLEDTSGQNVLIATYSQPPIAPIQSIAVTSNVVTVYTLNTPTAGQYVTFSQLTTIPGLNGLTILVASVSAGVSFTVAYTNANLSKTGENGTVATVIGPDELSIQSVSGSGFIYTYNKANATIQVLTTGTASGDALNELAAGSIPAGVYGDVVNYEASWVRQ